MRELYIEEINGNKEFENNTLTILDSGDTNELYIERSFAEFWTPTNQTETAGRDHIYYFIEQTVTNIYLEGNTMRYTENFISKTFKVKIGPRGNIDNVSYESFTRIDGTITNSSSEKLELDDNLVPKEFRDKANDISAWKTIHSESPRQIEALENKKNGRIINLLISGAEAGGKAIVKIPAGQKIIATIGDIMGFLVEIEYPTDPSRIRVISKQKERKSKTR